MEPIFSIIKQDLEVAKKQLTKTILVLSYMLETEL